MTFDELLKEIGQIPCQEIRADEADYCERVTVAENMPRVIVLLKTYFGEALKPAGGTASSQVLKYAEPYGGVQGNQTMYYRDGVSGPDLALLWPWGNGQATTIKIIRAAAPSV